jgi:hypothetical protein
VFIWLRRSLFIDSTFLFRSELILVRKRADTFLAYSTLSVFLECSFLGNKLSIELLTTFGSSDLMFSAGLFTLSLDEKTISGSFSTFLSERHNFSGLFSIIWLFRNGESLRGG